MGFLNLFSSKAGKSEFVAAGHSPRLALDGNGGLWIAFFARGVKLAHCVQKGKWEIAPIDEARGLKGSPPGLVVEAGGLVHIAYCDMGRRIEGHDHSLLGLARFEKGTLSLQILDTGRPDCCGVYPSLAVSPSGRMAVSYHFDEVGDYDLGQEVIKVSVREAAGWQNTTLAGSAPGGYGSALAFDPSGRLHVAFNQRVSTGACYDGPIFHAVEKEGDFELVRVDAHNARHPSLAVDSRGLPHLAYIFELGAGNRIGHLAYATLLDGAWHIQDLGIAESTFGRTTSIAVDLQNSPQIAYTHGGKLMLAAVKNGSWQTEKIWEWKSKSKQDMFYPEYCVYPSLVIAPGGHRLVCFQTSNSSNKDEIHLLRL